MNTKHLKSKILDLAIRGKLVPQDSSEGNAADLLKKIRDEKGGESLPLAAAGRPSSATPSAGSIAARNARSKNASFIIKADNGRHYEQFADGTQKDIEDEIPFDEPIGWTWCRVNEIAVDMADGPFGSNLKSDHYTTNKEARIIQLSNLSDEGWKEENTRYTTIKHATENISRSIVEPGNIVIAKMMPAGRAMICPDRERMYVLSSDCVKLVPIMGVDKQFLVRALNSPFFRSRVVENVQGVTRLRTSISKLRNCFFPLPPLSEQQRIVSAIEKSFEQIDIIEKNKLNLKTYIKQTKSKVLDLAIHGKLAAQNPQEGNAFELLKKIRNEKAELIKQKKLKEDKSAGFIIKAKDGRHYEQFADGTQKDIEDEIPFKIPENWCWCRLNQIADIERGGSPRPIADFLTKKEDGINWIKIGDTKKGDKYIESVKEKIIPEGIRYSRLVHAGDFLLTNSMSFGRPYILKVDGCIHDGWLVFGNILSCITSEYLFQLLSSPFIYQSFVLTAAGSTVKNLNIDRVKQVLFPLPPLSEQQRIVAKIEQIFAQLDALEKSLGE